MPTESSIEPYCFSKHPDFWENVQVRELEEDHQARLPRPRLAALRRRRAQVRG